MRFISMNPGGDGWEIGEVAAALSTEDLSVVPAVGGTAAQFKLGGSNLGEPLPLPSAGWLPVKTTTVTSASILTMTIDSAQVQELTGSTTHTVKLPTTGIKAGMSYTVINNSSGAVAVQSSGGNAISTLSANTLKLLMPLVDSPTTAAHWRAI